MRVLIASAALSTRALLLLGLAGCGAPHNDDLFRSSGTLAETGGAGNASGASAYPNAGARPNVGKSEGSAGGSEETGGESSAPPNAGAASAAGGSVNDGASSSGASSSGASSSGASSSGASSSGASSSGASAGGAAPSGGTPGDLSDCAQFGADASFFAETQHCYLAVHVPATFAAAQTHCKTLGGHLVTLASQAENDFAWSLDDEEHWIGASDGKSPTTPDSGTFSWVTGEPFAYSDWSSGQPNASDTNCGDSGVTGHCYEHCAFQWTGGEQDGQWNDRFCLHTIAAICEFEGGG